MIEYVSIIDLLPVYCCICKVPLNYNYFRLIYHLDLFYPIFRVFRARAETVYATRSFLLIIMFVWRGCPLIKNRAEITGWHKQSQASKQTFFVGLLNEPGSIESFCVFRSGRGNSIRN